MNEYNPNIHHRKSIRLKGYDYSKKGLYFITICVQDRLCLFGDIDVGASLVDALNTDVDVDYKNAQMILNDAGKMVESEWLKLSKHFKNIELHEFVVMPNHFHAILEIVETTGILDNNEMVQKNIDNIRNGQPQGFAPSDTTIINDKTIGDMVGAFKSIVTVNYIRGVKSLDWKPFNGKLWQRNYWEHIIRNEPSYQRISNYIINNPIKWLNDKFYKL
jgi:putative transposase